MVIVDDSSAQIKLWVLYWRRHIDANMDSKVPSDEVPIKQARESLIAISYTVLDTSHTDHASRNIDGAKTDGTEKCRSELICISYDHSPDVQEPPILLGTHVGQ
ncbi:hypothetical protein J1N35_009127 [Gossypium stocksii]|uniref:Uncharacterized protein n=1 Tax=Gossypium stocksii TaxID=47602 RepID=A0A9D3W939_9ROSI|nr:hypothetical protein J1N35_009127 [Gossypium stocksii]